jgi:hypothetical protein
MGHHQHPNDAITTIQNSHNSSKLGSSTMDITKDKEEQCIQRGIVEAHNRWAYAREENFAKVQDIEKLTIVDGNSDNNDDSPHHSYVMVEWKSSLKNRLFQELGFGEGTTTMAELIKKDPAAAAANGAEPAEVWINGLFVGHLDGPASVPTFIAALAQVTSRRLAYKRSNDGIIRIERYFGSYLRQKNEIFDHVLDNLIAMEDVEVLDNNTLIGTATLCDWIMGGKLRFIVRV